MIRHVVLWKLDASYSEPEKAALLKEFRTRLLELKNHIAVLKQIDVYINDTEAAKGNFDIMLDTLFQTMNDVTTYQVHPQHVKVAEYVKNLKLQRAAIDFTI